MNMLIASQNLTNYDVELPQDTIYRINLAWINDLETLKNILEKHQNHKIFIDLPKNRTKPPNNKYSMEQIKPILEKYKNIKYFAISNVSSSNDLKKFIDKIPNHVSIIPKIESPEGVVNIKDITDTLRNEKIIMLDHDDLYSNLIKKNENPEKFKEYILNLSEFCQKNNVIMLRTIGVVFSDDEKRITQYMK